MEQTALSNTIHVTKDFYDVVKDYDDEDESWVYCGHTQLKNIGKVQSWRFDPKVENTNEDGWWCKP